MENKIEFTQDGGGIFGFLENVHYGKVTEIEMLDFSKELTNNYETERVKSLRESIGQLRGQLLFNKGETYFHYLDIFEEIIVKEYRKKAINKINGSRPKAVLRPVETYFSKKFREKDVLLLLRAIKNNYQIKSPKEFVFMIVALKDLGWIQSSSEKDIWMSFEEFYKKSFSSEANKGKHHRNIISEIDRDTKKGSKNKELEKRKYELIKIKESEKIV